MKQPLSCIIFLLGLAWSYLFCVNSYAESLGLYVPPKAQLQSNQVPFCNDKIKQMSRLIYKLQLENSAIRLVLRATKGIGPIK